MSAKATRLDLLLAASITARKLVKAELRILVDSYANPSTGEVEDATGKRAIAKHRRAIKQLDIALARYGVAP